jgi:phosphoribosyl 1,2-cyclic phosphodiesterase
MSIRFTVLASGSGGNATLLKLERFGLLIDVGLGPRQLASRLAAIGASWRDVQAVLLTHTHTDHWKDRTLQQLLQHNIRLYCHPDHHRYLESQSSNFRHLQKANLVHDFDGGQEFQIGEQIRAQPVEVKHDSVPTFGFRLDGTSGLFGESWSVGYLADLGCWSSSQVNCAVDVDLLALEFNHDENLERNSNRPIQLIDRVLGDHGHLSNDQAAGFLQEVIEKSTTRFPGHLVQLHLSRECNRPALAQMAARKAIVRTKATIGIHTASQDRVGPTLTLDPNRPRIERRIKDAVPKKSPRRSQPLLPGLE